MTSEKHDPREEPVLLTPDEGDAPPSAAAAVRSLSQKKVCLNANADIVMEQDRIINEKVLRNKAIQELDREGFRGGFSRRDKGWLLLGFAFFYLVSFLLGYRPSIKTAIGGGFLSSIFLFLVVFLIEEFTRFRFPRIRLPIVDDLIYYAFDLIWNHRIISTGIVIGLLVASSFFVGTEEWKSPYDADRATLEEQCKKEVWESCVRLGRYWQEGIGEVKGGLPVPSKDRDAARAFTLYRKGCDGGNGTGCLGMWLLWGRKETFVIDRDEALALLKKGCDLKDALACQVRSAYDQGLDVAGHPDALSAISDDMAAELGLFLSPESDTSEKL